ncbi:uncharacterized protein [Euwallacea fornicatus]|uniref:uncharacterized protein n=1 Tax=Euwallacea fornicatus TaxID=995702 RepID=UPI00338D9C99
MVPFFTSHPVQHFSASESVFALVFFFVSFHCHSFQRAAAVIGAIENASIDRLPFSSRSSDFNPIELVRDMLERNVEGHLPRPKQCHSFGDFFHGYWENLPRDNVPLKIRQDDAKQLYM